jgi:alanyl-tRNA synthetase
MSAVVSGFLGTQVTFHLGALAGKSRILDARSIGERIALLLERTSFHPVDPRWPDQPADKGTLTVLSRVFPVEECCIYALHRASGELKEVKAVAKQERADYVEVVAHLVDPKGAQDADFIGAEVQADVDPVLRAQLSLQHSASHLAAFALNVATREFWSKTPSRVDTLGNPNFDHLAMSTSFIYPDHCEDVYRFGKSVKKEGLDVNRLFNNIEQVQSTVNQLLKEWIMTGTPVELIAKGPALSDQRVWRCALPKGMAEMPCGGTHVASLRAFSEIAYRLAIQENGGEKTLHASAIAIPS